MIKKIITTTLDVLFPRYCLCCHNPTHHAFNICQPCIQDLPWLKHCCSLCGSVFKDNLKTLCGQCLQKPPLYQAISIPFQYKPPISLMINQIKHHDRFESLPFLVQALITQIDKNQLANINCIIALPSHHKKLKQRGYNQTQLFAKSLSTALHIPVDNTLLIKHKHTPDQRQLNRKERLTNLKQCFKVRPHQYTQVALVDDVITTGTTINEACRALKQSGVNDIFVWVIARA